MEKRCEYEKLHTTCDVKENPSLSELTAASNSNITMPNTTGVIAVIACCCILLAICSMMIAGLAYINASTCARGLPTASATACRWW